MKTKMKTHPSHYRQHERSIMYLSVIVLLLCLCKFDNRLVNVFRQAYNQGFGILGTYMREGEMTRFQTDFGIAARIQTTSSN